jgi:hypothetical protein
MHRVVVRMRMMIVVLALAGAACGGGDGDDDRQCRSCTVSENCENDQECVLAVDNELRCFEVDKETCTLDRVIVGRAPTPASAATP